MTPGPGGSDDLGLLASGASGNPTHPRCLSPAAPPGISGAPQGFLLRLAEG